MRKIKFAIKSISNKKLLVKEIVLNIDDNNISLSDFIKILVNNEVNNYNEKIKKSQNNNNFEFNFFILDWKYSFWNIYNDKIIDISEAEKTAILWFKDWLFTIFYGDIEIKSLDEIIDLDKNDIFTFIRLNFLSWWYF